MDGLLSHEEAINGIIGITHTVGIQITLTDDK